MDDLRPHDEHDEHEEPAHDIVDEPVDAVVDRLAAYTHSAEDEHPAELPQFDPGLEVEMLELADEPRRFGRLRNRPPKGERPEKAEKPEKQRKDKRAKKLVGLKIGASQIAAAHVVNNGSPELVEVVREPLEQGVVVAGEIRDPEALGDALKRFFDLHKLPKNAVRLGVANNRIGVRIFEIEGISDPQMLENAIRFRAEEVLPIPLDQAVLDYVVLDGRTEGTAPSGSASSWSSPIGTSSTGTSRPAGARGCRSSASTTRRSLCFVLSVRPSSATRRRERSWVSRSATTARPSPFRTASTASSRECSTGAAGR
jgi:hypothetical protein